MYAAVTNDEITKSGFSTICQSGELQMISKQEVEYVAHLARLEIDDTQKDKFTSQLNDILLYIEKLNELDTKGVEPISHTIAVTNAFREDKVHNSLGTEKTLDNAPDARGEFFRVPKVIE
jgi:aspartyl-tRNA(Asn)/glutamyl-tRNA(Gln) amidotransferase subunit C